jgi:hypothetical protein
VRNSAFTRSIRKLGRYLFALASMAYLFGLAAASAQSTPPSSLAGAASAASGAVTPRKVVPAPQNDWWLNHFPSWLVLTNKCFSQVSPSYETLIEGTVAQNLKQRNDA